MPRLKHIDPPVAVKINVPESVLMRLELLYFDPFLMRAKSGSRSGLITELLVGTLFKPGEYMPDNPEQLPQTLQEETVTLDQVNDLRKKLNAKEKVNLEDLRIAYAYTRQSRIAAVSMNGKPKKAAKKEKGTQLTDAELKALLPELDIGSMEA